MLKHYMILKNKKPKYLCNTAVNTTPEKYAKTKKEVTCKNCLKTIKPEKYAKTKKEVTCKNCLKTTSSKMKEEQIELKKLEKDYRQYQLAQEYSNMLILMGMLGYAISLIMSFNMQVIILMFVSSVSIGFAIGMKIKTIKKVIQNGNNKR